MQILQQPQTPYITLPSLDGKTDAEKKDTIGEYIYNHAIQLHPSKAGKIAGMMLEFPLDTLMPVISNPQNLMKNINDAAVLIDRQGQ
jgi:hypothetical protein